MATSNGSDARFALVTAGHQFLLRVLPFQEPESRYALEAFINIAGRHQMPTADIDAVLLRILAVLDRHTEGRLPTLVDRYVSGGLTRAECLNRFSQCVLDILRFRGIGDGVVQQVIDLISAEHAAPKLTPAWIAQRLGVRLPTLCVAFNRETGVTLGEHIRSVRLDHAAMLLVTTNRTIKEIWAEVGYNHASNFDHEFKQRFGATPSAYRARALLPAAQERYRGGANATRADPQRSRMASAGHTVLIVDDDEYTRITIGTFLRLQGAVTATASSGAAGFRLVDTLSPDVILLDYRMDDIDGLAFLRKLRTNTPAAASGGKPPAVALFTADWDVFDWADEARALNALIVSKLSDLDQIADLVVYLSTQR
jgi:AraC-like DNA-binding protein